MSGGARLAFLAAAIVVLVVAFIVLRPSSEDTELTADPPTPTATASASATSESPTPTASPTPKPTVDPGPILTGEEVEKLRFDKGETVRFRVRAPEDEEVHIHGYDISRDVEGGKTENISFKATIDGIFEIEFEHAGTQIASLRVDP
jgi:hypothetical protein